jgi:hypothetical protein
MSEGSAQISATTVREAVGVFHHWQNLQGAVDELLAHGFDRSEISLLASEKTVVEKLGHIYTKVSEIEDNPDVPRIAYIGRDSLVEAKAIAISGLGYVGAVAAVGAVVASGGTLAAAIMAAVAAGLGGAGIGTVLSRLLGRERASSIESQINKGGLILWVRTRDDQHEKRALEILKRHQADDVHIHAVETSSAPATDPLAGVEPDPFLPRART